MIEYSTVTYNIYKDSIENNKEKYTLFYTYTEEAVIGTKINECNYEIADKTYYLHRTNLPIKVEANANQNIVNIYFSKYYRKEKLNEYLNNVNEKLATTDMMVFFKLLAAIYGDLYSIGMNIDQYVDIDLIDEEHLRHLCKIIGYEWCEGLTADEQRESVKFYVLLRRMRGTTFALKNLIRIFGQDRTSLYQQTDNTGVRITEYVEGNHLEMFPGDIRVEIPEMSAILRDAINNIKLMGTRLIFAYMLPIDSTYTDEYGLKRGMFYSAQVWNSLITSWYKTGLKGFDRQVAKDKDGNDIWRTPINQLFDNCFIYKYRDTYELHSGATITMKEVLPYTDVFLFDMPGLVNVRGILTESGILAEDNILYR